MHTSTTRSFTPIRIVALFICSVLISGLAYLRVTQASGSVSVPKEGKADQLTNLKPCTYATEDGSYAADCGTLVVPENRNNPESRLIALPVTRIRSKSPQPAEPLFRLEGGPGSTNMEFSKASRFAQDRDVVLVGYRGVDGSSVLDCPEVTSAVKGSTDRLSEKAFDAYTGGFRACATRLSDKGVDLEGYSLTQQVDDFEAARVALGYGKIDLVSESAGTRTAMIYAWRYPQSIHRSVMVGVNPPGHYLWDGAVTDRQLRRYAELCAADDACRQRTGDLVASMTQVRADMPDRWGFLPIKDANVRIASFLGLFETSPTMSPATGPQVVDAWLSAAEGDASGMWFASVLGDFLLPQAFVWGQFAAVGVQDAPVADAYFAAGGGKDSVLGNPATAFTWGGGRLGQAWPASPDDLQYSKVQTSAVETLLISGELDFTTPPDVATVELLPYLPNGHQVMLAGFGHSGSFWNDQVPAGTHLINTFLDSGAVDSSLYTPVTLDFSPSNRFSTMGKVLFTIMVGGACLMMLSLVGIGWRVRRRGSLGRVASIGVRTVGAIVLGLGGWFLGALVVMATMPGVPLDSDLLAALAIGIPVGIGVYLAWTDRASSATTRGLGYAAAAGGALVGAWLGFHATEGLVALVTTIVGAIVGANLLLLVLDITGAGQGSDAFDAGHDRSYVARPLEVSVGR